MFSSTITAWVLTLSALAAAVPTRSPGTSPNPLSKRSMFQFLQFDETNPTDKGHMDQLTQAFKDSMELVSYVVSESAWDLPVFSTYFPPEAKDLVKGVFEAIHGGNDAEGSPNIGRIRAYNRDISGLCNPDPNVDKGEAAYMYQADPNNPLMVTCPLGYKLKSMADTGGPGCGNLGDTVSVKMQFLGSIIFHEYTHVDFLAATGFHIQDFGEEGYGPLNVRTLLKNDPAKPPHNADSYHWFALEHFWTVICGHPFSGPRDSRDTEPAAFHRH